MADIVGLIAEYASNPNERFFRESFNEREYAGLRTQYPVVIDVGALAGEFCAYIYDQTDVIYAIEPMYHDELAKNVDDYNMTKVKTFDLALAGHNGSCFIKYGDRGAPTITDDNTQKKVRCLTLAQFIKDQDIKHVDLLKIDVEGSEEFIFKSNDFYQVSSIIDAIFGEHISGFRDLFENMGFELIPTEKGYFFKR